MAGRPENLPVCAALRSANDRLRHKAADTIDELHDALEICLAMAQRKSLTSPLNLNGQSPYDIGIAAIRKARGQA